MRPENVVSLEGQRDQERTQKKAKSSGKKEHLPIFLLICFGRKILVNLEFCGLGVRRYRAQAYQDLPEIGKPLGFAFHSNPTFHSNSSFHSFAFHSNPSGDSDLPLLFIYTDENIL